MRAVSTSGERISVAGRLLQSVVLCGVIAGLPAGKVFGAAAESAYAQGTEACAVQDYGRGAPLLMAAAEQDDGLAAERYYAAAGCFALAGEHGEAFRALDLALDAGFQNAWGEAERDPDLAPLRNEARWPAFLERAAARARADRAFWNHPSMQTGFKADISVDEKNAGLAKLWAEAKFNFIHFDTRTTPAWDEVYMAYLPKVRATRSTFEYYRALMSMYALLGDGHTSVVLPKELWDTGYARPPLRTMLVEGRVIVVAVAGRAGKTGIAPGDEITAIDGVPVKEYAQRHVAPYQSASTPQDREARVYGGALLEGKKDRAVEVTVVDGAGRSRERKVTRVPLTQWFEAFQQAPMVFRRLPGNVAYVALNSFEGSETAELFQTAFAEIRKADALVIDLRENGGGNSEVGDRVLACLTDKGFDGLRWATRDYKPALRAWGFRERRFSGLQEKVAPNGELHFGGPVVVLTSPRTYSAAEDFAAEFRGMGRGRIVGEATGGSTGQPLFFPLPGGGYARVCTKHDMLPDGTEFVGRGIEPDVTVGPTLADLRAGRDTVLEAALAVLAQEGTRTGAGDQSGTGHGR